MAKKTNGKTEIELETLNPEKFQTLQEIRDFVTGEGASALRFAIGAVLNPELSPLDMSYLGNALKEARDGAYSVNNDLEILARVAVKWEADAQPTFYRFAGCDKDRQDRRSLAFIVLRHDDVADWLEREIIDHLGCADMATAHA